ncbi:MAG: universal stress protein, partial [Halobacteriales archaeon]|nr:universal stress protein [Halobacteriales archaeon]
DDLVVLHVMSQRDFDSIRENAGESRRIVQGPGGFNYQSAASGEAEHYEMDNGMADARSVAREVAESTLNDLGDVEFKGLVGQPVEQILGEADRLDVRFIVAGGRKRTAVGKAIFGSVTQSLLLESDRPVVTVMED